MRIRNENTVLRTHCDDSDGFFWTSSMESLRKIIPGHTTKCFPGSFESSDYPLVLFRTVKRDSAGKKWEAEFFSDRMELTYKGKTSTPKVYPGHTHVVFVEAPKSMTYGDRLRFMGCYELTGIAGKTFIYSLVSREFDLASANDVELAA